MTTMTETTLDDLVSGVRLYAEESIVRAFELGQAKNVERFNDGLDTAWDCVKEINYMPLEELQAKFGTTNRYHIIDNYTPEEVMIKLGKLVNELEVEFNVGDEVMFEDNMAIVLDVVKDDLTVLTEYGDVLEWSKSVCKKTGKQCNLIDKIIEQIHTSHYD